MAKLESQLRLTLIDQVSGRMGRIGKALATFRAQTSRNMLAPVSGTIGRMAALGGAYLGVTQGMSGTIGAARDQQSALTEIGIKAGMTDGAINQLRTSMTKLSPRVNQTTSELLKGVDTMVTMGLSAEQAASAMPAIGKTATATMSSIDDLSAASVSAMQNFKVAPSEIARMLDGMAEAGNQGAFEMRDMASEFPALTASAKSLGMEGVDGIIDMAAALQIARRGAGSASTAANNLNNFLGKLMSPEVSKRFKKFGVDTTKELQKAHKKGVSPIQHFIELVDEKTKGGQADLLGQLFGDRQVLEFVRPMLADFKDYIRIRGDAERASGTVADAYARRMEDANERIKSFRIQMQNLGTSIGRYTLGPIGDAAKYLADVFNSLDRRVTIFHRLKAAGEGFFKGLGFKSGSLSGAMKEIREFLFGVADGSKAADQYGLIFKRFHDWGRSVREFTDSVKDNPLVKFLGEMAGHGFKLMLATVGISMLAGAVGKLARAMWLLSGASTAVSILKLLGSVGGALLGSGAATAGGGLLGRILGGGVASSVAGGAAGAAGGGVVVKAGKSLLDLWPKNFKGPWGMAPSDLLKNLPKGARIGPTGVQGLGGEVATAGTSLLRQWLLRVPAIALGAGATYGAGRIAADLSKDNADEGRQLATHRDAERYSMDRLAEQRAEIEDMLADRRAAKGDKPAVGFFNSPAWSHVEKFGSTMFKVGERMAGWGETILKSPLAFDKWAAEKTGWKVNVPSAQPPAIEIPPSIFDRFLGGMQRLNGPETIVPSPADAIRGLGDVLGRLTPPADPIPTLQSIRDAVGRPPAGTTDVRVINPTPVHAPINVTVYATTNADPNQIAQHVGAKVQDTIAGYYGTSAYE